jgi:hypothetical protein
MAFNTNKFLKTKLTPRTGIVKVPDMADFFEPNTPAEFKVRGIDGTEFTNVREASEKHKNILGLLEGLMSTVANDKLEALRESLQLTDSVPVELAKRLEMAVLGCVDPVVDLELAKKIAKTYPIDFYAITTKILELTGLGHVPLAGVRPSGATTESNPHSPSAMPEVVSSSK